MRSADPGAIGNGGTPTVTPNQWANVQWLYPVAAPTPDHFEVILTTDPTGVNTDDIVKQAIKVPATDRYAIFSFTPPPVGVQVYAAVRAVFVGNEFQSVYRPIAPPSRGRIA